MCPSFFGKVDMITVLIDTASKVPIYEQIYIYLREEIRNGNIACGTKLPSSRGLANYLEVSRNTIDMAYGQLQSEGYIESFPKKGYFVCALENLYDDGCSVADNAGRRAVRTEQRVSRTEASKKDTIAVDFSLSGVDMDYFPYSKWRKLTKECLIDDNKELFLAGEHQGDLVLRQAVQIYLHQARGVQCDVDQIIIGAGSDYMLLLLSRILGRQQTVAMENPTYKQAYTIFDSVGYSIVPIPMDEQGMQVEALRESPADLAYVTPSHQFPLGTVMSANRKRQLLAWASAGTQRYIIEDDYDSEFRYSGKPIPALQSQDPFEKVIYVGTLSKVIAPAIRLSYMVLPQTLLQTYRERAGFYFSTVSRIDQQVIGQFFLQGHFERHLNRMRKIYRMKHDCLMQELKGAGFEAQIKGESAGLHVLLQFGSKRQDVDKIERRLVDVAAKHQVKVYPLGDYYITEEERIPTILIGFARLKEQEIIDGVARLRKAWKEQEGLICTE